nr:hypothetical protein [uncultured Bacillus sp.]
MSVKQSLAEVSKGANRKITLSGSGSSAKLPLPNPPLQDQYPKMGAGDLPQVRIKINTS